MSKHGNVSLREKLNAMSPMQRQLFLDVAQVRLATSRAAIPRGGQRERFALSFPQRRLWFLHRIDPDSTMYNMPECARLIGPLDVAVFQSAFDAVVARHETLRVTFDDGPEGPIQIVSDTPRVPIEFIDMSHVPSDRREREARALLFTIADRPFDLRTGPVVRMTLMRLTDEEHFFVINMHHIVSDGWSMGVFAEEFARCVEACLENRAPDPAPLPIAFSDFVDWQLARLTGQTLDKQLAYWKPRLAEIEDVILPFDRNPSAATTERGGFEYIVFEPQLSDRIRDCARLCDATLFMFLLATFGILLHRYSAQTSITVGSPTAGRIRRETERLIGFFANTLLITANVQPEYSVRQVVETVKESAIGAFGHDETPLERLVEMLRPDRDMARNPLFQVMFILQNTRKPTLKLPGLKVKLFSAGSMSVKFDMLMEFYELPEGITGWLGYRRDLFNEETMTRFAADYQFLMRAIIDNLDTPIRDLPVETLPCAVAFNDDLDSEF